MEMFMQRNRKTITRNSLSSMTTILAVALVFALNSAPAVWAQPARGALPDPKTFQYRDLTRELANKMAGTYVITTVGDVLMMEPISKMIDPKIQQILRDADTAIGNMEVNIIDRRNWTSGFAANISPMETAADFKALGFDMLTGANNHSFDMGEEGSRSTAKWLAEQGIPLAGVGPNLATARMPVFQLTAKGRVGMVSAAASSQGVTAAASNKNANMGLERWGVNPVRSTVWNVVTQANIDYLKGIRDVIVARRGELKDSSPIAMPKDEPNRVQIFNENYIAGPKVGEYRYEINKEDLEANLVAIRNTKEYGDFAIFNMHAHYPPNAFQTVYVGHYPSQFVTDFAHALIDNGADVFVGHGLHSMQGIEIYKGRPIFYGLGEFVLQEIVVDKSDTPPRMTPIEWDELPTQRLQEPHVMMAVMATSRYQDGKLVEIRLQPVDLGVGQKRPWSKMGVPQIPSPELANEILAKVQEYSETFHTKISIENGVGVIRVPPEATVPVGAEIRSTFAKP
jgi:poly-gamma-glutamate capsule biosynthesis protein CapA/YwtB (metallophosphatase superfamily)